VNPKTKAFDFGFARGLTDLKELPFEDDTPSPDKIIIKRQSTKLSMVPQKF